MLAYINRITFVCLLLTISILQTKSQSTISPHSPHCGFDEFNHLLEESDPDFKKEQDHFLQEVVSKLAGQPKSAVEPLLTIPVVVHIIHNGEAVGEGPNLSDQQIIDQIDILNQDFSAVNQEFFNTPTKWAGLTGVPNIQFLFATVDPTGAPTNGITRHNMAITGTSWNNNNINSVIKPATKWNPDKYMNIYVLSIPGTTAAGGVVGFSNYPTSSLIGADRDGPVVDFNWFGGPGHPVSGWRPITHETGHYLGLPHTFNGTSCSSDDSISDTPNADDATSSYVSLDCATGYPVGPVSCSEEHLFVNYMDYVNENCYTSFTQGQVNVMRSVLDGTSSGFGYGSREELIQEAPSLTSIPMHDAGIIRLLSPEQSNCTSDVLVPSVSLRNFGQELLEAVSINYQIDNGPVISYLWQGTLPSGATVSVELPSFIPPNGVYDLAIFTTEPNGQPDERTDNDLYEIPMLTYFAFDPPMIELADGASDFPTPLGTFEFNFDGDDFAWEISNDASAYGYGVKSFSFNNRAGSINNNPSDSYDILVTRHFDFTDVSAAALYFDVAYASYNELQVDTLYILISIGCTQNFNTFVYKKWGQDLSTAPPTQTVFTPDPTQWRTEGVDLSFLDGEEDVSIGFLNVSNWGNRLFIDNIRVGVDCGQLTAEWDITPNGCDNEPGECSGAAEVNVPISNGDIVYEWEGWPQGHNESAVEELCEGTVQLTIVDEFGCEITVSNEIPQATPPELSLQSEQLSSYQSNDGTATASILNGMAPFSFDWSNGTSITSNSSTHQITNLSAGNYTVTISDAGNCSVVQTIMVQSVCTGFNASIDGNDALCFGLSNGEATVEPINGNGPFTFNWSNGVNSPTNSILPAGTHSVTVTDVNNCPAEATITIGAPAPIEITTTITNESTANAMDGAATALANGGNDGFSYNWSNGSTDATIDGLSAGTYFVTATDSQGCSEVETVVVLGVDCNDFQTTISWENLNCFGASNGTASVSVSGETLPVTYAWSNGDTTATIDNLSAATYTVTVMDADGCSAELSATVQEPLELLVDLSMTAESSAGANDGTASASPSGGIPFAGGTYQYNWSNGAMTEQISGLAAGPYSVTVTDFNGCTVVGNIVVTGVNCLLSIEMESENASCPDTADGSAAVSMVSNGTAPFNYLWSNGATGPDAENLLPGNYTVTITDINGCTANGWIPITGEDLTPPNLILLSSTTLSVGTGTTELIPNLIDNGSFDNCSMVNLSASQTSFDCDDIGTNQVTITGTDSNGNMAESTIDVIVQDIEAPAINCPDNQTLIGCGTVTYDLVSATDNCSLETIQLKEGLLSGQPFPIGTTVVVWEAIDASGNTNECSFEVFVDYDFALTNAFIVDPTCEGSNDGSLDLFIEGGEPPYQTMWSHGGGPTNLPAGTYTATITDSNGCTVEESFLLEDPPPFSLSVVEIIPAMGGVLTGEIQVSINGGEPPHQIDWYENGVLLPDFDPFQAPPGTYSVIATDYNGCTVEMTDLVVDNLNNTISILLERSIQLFPNPSKGQVSFALKGAYTDECRIGIYNVNGQRVSSFTIQQPALAQALDLTGLSKGIYWVQIVTNGEMAYKKLAIL